MMAKEFVFRDFVRLTSPIMLTEYCKHNTKVEYEHDPKVDSKDEVKRAMKVFESLLRQVRGEVELDFQEVNNLSSAEA